jgi:hypothetical protein
MAESQHRQLLGQQLCEAKVKRIAKERIEGNNWKRIAKEWLEMLI